VHDTSPDSALISPLKQLLKSALEALSISFPLLNPTYEMQIRIIHTLFSQIEEDFGSISRCGLMLSAVLAGVAKSWYKIKEAKKAKEEAKKLEEEKKKKEEAGEGRLGDIRLVFHKIQNSLK
jgi:hypothetical protein